MRKMTCLAILMTLAAYAAFAQSVERVGMSYVKNLTERQLAEMWPRLLGELITDSDKYLGYKETSMVPNPIRGDMGEILAQYTVKVGDVFVYSAIWDRNTAFTIFVRVKSATRGQAKKVSWFALEAGE